MYGLLGASWWFRWFKCPDIELIGVKAELVLLLEMDVSYELPKFALGVPGGGGGF